MTSPMTARTTGTSAISSMGDGTMASRKDIVWRIRVSAMNLPPNGDDEGACYAEGMAEKPIAEVAKELAEAHRKEDPDTKEIFLAPHPAEVRLVEVSGSLGSSGEVLPFRFAPSPENDVPYPSVVVLL